MASIRTHLVKAAMRLVIKRAIASRDLDPDVVLELRGQMESLGQRRGIPAGADLRSDVLGGVPAEWCTAPGQRLPGRVVLYLHGGGYLLGSPVVYRPLVAQLSAAVGVPVVTPDYRLAPEHPFPAAPDDAVAVYRALLAQGYGGDQIAVAGDSAGGNLVLVLLQRLRDAGLPGPACAVCLSPWTDLTGASASVVTHAERDPMLPASKLAQAAELYAPGRDLAQPLLSPVHADFTALAPLLVHVGSAEILLDDSVRVVARARSHGVRTEFEIWRDQPHVFQMLGGIVPEAGLAMSQIARFITTSWFAVMDRALARSLRAGSAPGR